MAATQHRNSEAIEVRARLSRLAAKAERRALAPGERRAFVALRRRLDRLMKARPAMVAGQRVTERTAE